MTGEANPLNALNGAKRLKRLERLEQLEPLERYFCQNGMSKIIFRVDLICHF
jgi:hypothetical protein